MIGRILLVIAVSPIFSLSGQSIYSTKEGKINFLSDAPLELITAASSRLKGAMDIENRTFAFSVDIKTFNGFNSPLQKEHFNENYMESDQFSEATFTGKIIEKINLSSNGDFTIRAKGKLNVHGVEQERIIKSNITVKDGQIMIDSYFTVYLIEHNILIPKIVSQKIAEAIQVRVEAALKNEN